MDTEDRDHFKTIAGAPGGLQGDSQKQRSKDYSDSDRYLAYCLRQAETIFGYLRQMGDLEGLEPTPAPQ